MVFLAMGIVAVTAYLHAGWWSRVLAVARERKGFTGQFPVVANRPPPGQKGN